MEIFAWYELERPGTVVEVLERDLAREAGMNVDAVRARPAATRDGSQSSFGVAPTIYDPMNDARTVWRTSKSASSCRRVWLRSRQATSLTAKPRTAVLHLSRRDDGNLRRRRSAPQKIFPEIERCQKKCTSVLCGQGAPR